MKHPPIIKQTHRHTRTLRLLNPRTQSNEQGFNIHPLDPTRHRAAEYLLQCFGVFTLHAGMILKNDITSSLFNALAVYSKPI